jgi:hypothetical protein
VLLENYLFSFQQVKIIKMTFIIIASSVMETHIPSKLFHKTNLKFAKHVHLVQKTVQEARFSYKTDIGVLVIKVIL